MRVISDGSRPAAVHADAMRARSRSRLAPISPTRAESLAVLAESLAARADSLRGAPSEPLAAAPLWAPAVAAAMIDLPRNSWLPPEAAATPPGADRNPCRSGAVLQEIRHVDIVEQHAARRLGAHR